jgi:hypothetical protein
MLVPAGGLAPDGRTWVPVLRRNVLFLVPVKALAKIFRARFLRLARAALPGIRLPEIPWDKPWVVFAKPTVQGADRVLEYLGRYVQRTALSEHALLSTDDQSVSFRYRDSRDGERKTMTLPADEFLRRLLQHVPPKGFHRVRAFGLLHPEHRTTLLRLQLLLAPRASANTDDVPVAIAHTRKCPTCGAADLRLIRRLSAAECLELEPLLALDPTARPPLARAPPPPDTPLTASAS